MSRSRGSERRWAPAPTIWPRSRRGRGRSRHCSGLISKMRDAMRLFFVLASALSFGVLLLPSRAQQPAPPNATQTKVAQAPAAQSKAATPAAAASQDDGKPLLFTTSSRLVVVDVTVKDKSG